MRKQPWNIWRVWVEMQMERHMLVAGGASDER